jgi:transcription antitermination protein NusB
VPSGSAIPATAARNLPAMRRSDQRRDAAVALYQRDVTRRPLEDLLVDAKPFTKDLALGADEHLSEIDAEIGGHAHGWTINRIAPLERAIMRIAVFEMQHRPEIPAAVSIDEAVNAAKRYCGAEAPGFVNGVLSAIARDIGAEASNEVEETPA